MLLPFSTVKKKKKEKNGGGQRKAVRITETSNYAALFLLLIDFQLFDKSTRISILYYELSDPTA